MKEWTWVGILNFFILQWLFVRLGRDGEVIDDRFVQTGWALVFALPLTGWWSNYVFYKRIL